MSASTYTSLFHSIPELRKLTNDEIDNLMASLLPIEDLSHEARRGVIARYASVLEGNFIYWMTAAYLSAKSQDAKPAIIDNLLEEVGDCHPAMLRRFAVAAGALPTVDDLLSVQTELAGVRLRLAKLSGVENLLTMAFFESWIQRFMPYLAALAQAQGSAETEYTDVHGVCDVAHSNALFDALEAELEVSGAALETDLFAGVHLLAALILKIATPETGSSLPAQHSNA